jgi:hypothetical protein
MRAVLATALLLVTGSALAAERVTVAGVSLEPPAGFEPRGDRLASTTDRAVWRFYSEEKAPDPDAWFNASWQTIVASGRDVKALPTRKMSLQNGLTLFVAAASMADARDNYRYLMVVAAVDSDSGRAHRTLFEAPSPERFNELQPLISKAAATMDFGGGDGEDRPTAPAREERAAAPASLPDGAYRCQVRVLAPSGSGPSFAASVLGTITIAGQRYGATGADGERAGGKLVVDGAARRVRFTGGPLDSWVGAIDGPGKLRFSGKTPADPGDSLRVHDHLCSL